MAHLAFTSGSQVECCTTNKELHNLIRGTPAAKNMHACGTSAPLLHVATEPKMGFRQELLHRLLHVTTEPSSWLQQRPTKDPCAGGSSSTWGPTQNAGHELIPTPDSEEWTDGKSVRRFRFPDTVWCNTINSDRTGKEDNNEFCLIEIHVPLRLSMVQWALLYPDVRTITRFQ